MTTTPDFPEMSVRQLLSVPLLFLAGLLSACTTGDDTGSGLIDQDDSSDTTWTLAVTGPDDADSGTLTVEAGDLTTGFVATLEDSDGDPVEDQYITVQASTGTINAPPTESNTGGDDTDENGEVSFSYQAPTELSSSQTVTITASVTLPSSQGGGTLETTYTLDLEPEAAPDVTITGPDQVAPGLENDGYTVTVSKASNGNPIADACVTLDVGTSASISPSADTTCTTGSSGWTTDDDGDVAFAVTPNSSLSDGDTLTITASATVDDEEGTATKSLTVASDIFSLIAPEDSSTIEAGTSAKTELHLRWTEGDSGSAQGISGTVYLSSDSATAHFLIGDSSSAQSSTTARTSVDSLGDFEQTIYLYDTTSDTVTVTATSSDASESTTLLVYFTDEPSEIYLTAEPLTIEASPSDARYSVLTATVLDAQGEALADIPVTFALDGGQSTTAGYLSNTNATTDDEGQATTQYEAGTATGTASITAETDNGVSSNAREITVESDSD